MTVENTTYIPVMKKVKESTPSLLFQALRWFYTHLDWLKLPYVPVLHAIRQIDLPRRDRLVLNQIIDEEKVSLRAIIGGRVLEATRKKCR